MRKSTFTTRFDKIYPAGKSKSKSAISKHFKIPMSVLNDVYDRGVGAFRTAGARAGVKSEDQWARARLYKLVLNIEKVRKGGKVSRGRGQDSDLVDRVVKKL